MRRLVQAGVVACAALLAVWTAVVRAQPPEDGSRDEGRALFRRGVAAADARDWDGAREAFRGAYELLREPAVLLNLAGSEVQAGGLLAGAHEYGHFLAVCESHDENLCAAATDALRQARSRTPRLRLSLTGLVDGDLLTLDGRSIEVRDAARERLLDPGAHELVVRRGDRELQRFRFTIEEGETQVLAGSISSAGPGSLALSDEPDGGGVLRSPWLWTGIGVAVVAAILTAVLLAGRTPDPYVGNFPPGHVVTP